MTAAEPPAGPSTRAREIVVTGAALSLFAAVVGLVLASAGATLGYDYDAYIAAARRLSEGLPLYDQSITQSGAHAVYLYPPPFAVAFLPMVALPDAIARLGWSIAMAVLVGIGALLLPVRRDTRLLVVILAALDWPVLYAIKLGQVEPILFVAFAATWRWRDRPGVVGFATAVGALVKVQPALVAAWAWTSSRCGATWQAIAWTLAIGGVATLATGPAAWASYAELLRGASGTFTTPHNFAPGAVAHLAGASDAVASVVQWISVGAAAVAVVFAWRRLPPVASLQATIVASQLLSSPLRDHYAVLLLLPTAWLLSHGRWWAVAFPLAGWLALGAGGEGGSPITAAVVPLTFFACLAVILVEGWRDRADAVPAPGCAVPAPAGS
jgi:hypothetical protein